MYPFEGDGATVGTQASPVSRLCSIASVSTWLVAAALFRIADCEAVRSGFLHQPVNALSSLALLVAAVWIARRASRVPAERPELITLAVIVAANGLGSFAFHGPTGMSARWFHDLAALSIPLFVAVHDVGLVRGTPVAHRLRGVAMGVMVVGAVLAAWPSLLVPLGFVGAVSAGVGELAAFRAGYRPRPGGASGPQLVAWGLVLGTLALAGLTFLLGRTQSPWCHPQSWFQLHAAWHVLVAFTSAAYAWAAFELRGMPPNES